MSFRPARVGDAPILGMISGGTGTGKTDSALILARGMVGPDGVIGGGDTESGRMSTFADRRRFQHRILRPPFRWTSLAEAAEESEALGHDIFILDSTSMAHVGPGGHREWVEEEVTRLLRRKASKDRLSQAAADEFVNDEFEREKVRWMARKAPSLDRQAALYHFLQRGIPVLFVCRARRLTEKVGAQIKNIGWQPVIHDELPFEMTFSFLLKGPEEGKEPPPPGTISWETPCKIDQPHRAIFREGERVTEEMGAAFMRMMRPNGTGKSGPAPFEVLRSDGKVIGLGDIGLYAQWWERAATSAPADALKALRQSNAERMSGYAEAHEREIGAIRRKIAERLGETPPPADDEDGQDGAAPQDDGFPGDKPLPGGEL